MFRGVLSRWADFVYRRHVAVLVILLVLTGVSSLSLTRLELSADVRALLPDDSPAVQAYFDLKESFGADLAVIVLEDSRGPVLEHADFVDELADTLAESELISSVDYRVYDNVPTSVFLERLPLLLSPEELDTLARRVSREEIRRQVRLDWIDLQGPMVPPLLKRLLKEDPLRLLELLKERLVTSRGGYSLDASSGYYVSHDETTLLLFLTPTRPSDDLPFARRLLAEIDDAVASVRQAYLRDREMPAADEVPGLRVGVTGAHAIAAVESAVLRRDTMSAVLWSLGVVLLLFVVTFKRIDAVLFVGIPLVAALAWTFGFTHLVVGRLNLLSTGFAAVVLGLGIDHAIHIYNRFLDHRALGDDTERSLEAAVAETGSGVLVGALTTAGAFYALTLYDFKGIREFGFIAGSGVVFALVAMLTLLPAMLALRERWHPEFHQRTLARFYTKEIVAYVSSRPVAVLVLSALVTAVLGVAASQVQWEGRVLGNDFSANPALQLRERLRARFASSPDSLIVILESENLEVLDAAGREAHAAAARLVRQRRVGSLDSLYNYLRTPEEQQATMVRLRTDPALSFDRISGDLRAALEDQGFALRPFRPYFATLEKAFRPDGPVDLPDLTGAASESPFLQRYVTRHGDTFTQAMYLTSGRRGFEREDVDAVYAALGARIPEMRAPSEGSRGLVAYLAGGKVLARELRGRMREGYALVTGAALLLVLTVLIIGFRRPGRVLLALVPLGLGVTWMLGIMALGAVHMNVINVPVTAMIVGIGIDDAVHVLHAYFHETRGDVARTFRTTGKALVLTTLTTMAGFGSLALAGHPALRSMGVLAILGAACCLVATLTTLAALLAWDSRRRTAREAAAGG